MSGRLAAPLTGSRPDEFISDAPYGRAQLEIENGPYAARERRDVGVLNVAAVFTQVPVDR